MTNNELTRDTRLEVTNRSNSTVILKVPDRHFRAELHPHETRPISYGDILDIVAQPGGRSLLYNFLLIKNPQALRQGLNVSEEPEYWLTEEKIATWMPTCSLNEFIDALHFAPQGVLDLIKKYAVELPLNDVEKRNAIKDVLKFDVNLAVANNTQLKEDSVEADTASKRRSSTVSFDVPSDAVVEEAPKYKRTVNKDA